MANKAMKLCKKHFEIPGTALYFWDQAGHRKTAIELAVSALRELSNEPEEVLHEANEWLREWTIEAVFQGAWMREYHHRETDTKAYFEAMHARNASSAPRWWALGGSHVEKVQSQLALFSATEPSSIGIIDQMRNRLNDTKHDGSYLATTQDYHDLADAISSFWDELDRQEDVDFG